MPLALTSFKIVIDFVYEIFYLEIIIVGWFFFLLHRPVCLQISCNLKVLFRFSRISAPTAREEWLLCAPIEWLTDVATCPAVLLSCTGLIYFLMIVFVIDYLVFFSQSSAAPTIFPMVLNAYKFWFKAKFFLYSYRLMWSMH